MNFTSRNVRKKASPLKKRSLYKCFSFFASKAGVHQSKKDQCDDCVAFENQIKKSEEQIKEHEHHLKMKNKSRAYKDKIKEKRGESNVAATVFGLQQVLNCPHGHALSSSLHYKRKLVLYNSTA